MYYLIISTIIILIIMNKETVFPKTKELKTSLLSFDFNVFTPQLVGSESSDSYNPPYNGVAYGRYQFTLDTIKQVASELHINTPTVSEFINNHSLQDQFFRQYVNDILYFISTKNLNDFIGQKITGHNNKINTEINIYGLVAGAWLGGMNGLYNYLNNGIDKHDKFNTYISDYIAKFSFFNNLNF